VLTTALFLLLATDPDAALKLVFNGDGPAITYPHTTGSPPTKGDPAPEVIVCHLGLDAEGNLIIACVG
jgi:hypothetical protein